VIKLCQDLDNSTNANIQISMPEMYNVLDYISIYLESICCSHSCFDCDGNRYISKQYNNYIMIEKGDIGTIEAIIGFVRVTNHEVSVMENFMNKYIDKNVHICRHCSAQIRHAHQRLIDWYNNNSTDIERIKNQPSCECGAILPDKRYKYCEACKTK